MKNSRFITTLTIMLVLCIGCFASAEIGSHVNSKTGGKTETVVSDVDSEIQSSPESTVVASEPVPESSVNEREVPDQAIVDIPLICQYPDLPTGCEAVAATMVLQYYGEKITKENFARDWLEWNDKSTIKEGISYRPDPNKVFVGNPFSYSSFGCFAPPIANAINKNSTLCGADVIYDRSLEQLCNEYISQQKPLLIWATMSMYSSSNGPTWHADDQNTFTWINNEHCYVLIGYNSSSYYLADPERGRVVQYSKSLVEKRYKELNCQAVYIYKK